MLTDDNAVRMVPSASESSEAESHEPGMHPSTNDGNLDEIMSLLDRIEASAGTTETGAAVAVAEAPAAAVAAVPVVATGTGTGLLNGVERIRAFGPVLAGAVPVLGVALALRLWEFSQLSPYMDESNYIVTGRTLLEQGQVYANALQWTFGSFLYPIMVGWLDAAGGLAAARSLSVIAGLVMVLAVILATVGLFKALPGSRGKARADFALGSKPVMAGLLAGLLVAVMPTAIALSRFATYDATAAAFFAVGGALFVWARREMALVKLTSAKGLSRTTLVLYALAALALFAAFLTKYVVALYLPALCILVLASSRQERKLGGLGFVAPLTVACALYYLIFSNELNSLLSFASGYKDLRTNDFLSVYVWQRLDIILLALMAYWGLRQAIRDVRPGPAILLWVGALLLLIFQFATRPDFDYWKHSIYLVILLAPMVGWLWSDWSWWDEPGNGTPRMGLLSRLSRRGLGNQPRYEAFQIGLRGTDQTERAHSYSLLAVIAVVLVALGVFVGHSDAVKLTSHWPNVSASQPQIEASVKGVKHVLVDDSALVYYMYGKVPTDRITTPFYNDYKGLSGTSAAKQAVRDQYYDLIILDGGAVAQGKQLNAEIVPVLNANSAYLRTYATALDITNLDEPHTQLIYRLLTAAEQREAASNPLKPAPLPNDTKPTAVASATPSAQAATTAKPTAVASTAAAEPTPAPTVGPRPTAIPAKPVAFPAKPAYEFEAGDQGWGGVPFQGTLEPGMAVAPSDAYKLDGHYSLRFTPNSDKKITQVGVNRTGKASKIAMYVFIPEDKADHDIQMGMYYFDEKWGWHDDGFQTKVRPGQWTQLTFKLPEGQTLQQIGLKLVGFSGSIYLSGVTID